ncbi:hypothetical protein [Acaryochloris sp. IP29b_bin.137]|uniref:hypothetical protein n=1 Tax=Acaryochloris sp. IP29b_bin.137 TaxID=2969217 RepID=UPI00261C0C9C|nr:hypothetical protein [Acaryochloris sp. IP29b_bin.137]
MTGQWGMLLIDQKDLEARGITCQGVSEFVFLDKCFQKGESFETHQRETAISSCRQMLDAGLMSLIVNYQSHFTIWIESDAESVQGTGQQALENPENGVDESSAVGHTSGWNYKQIMDKLNEPVDMKAIMDKLNEPISFKSIFSKTKDSQS